MWAALSWRAVWLGLAAGTLASGVFFGVGYLAVSFLDGAPARAVVLVVSVLVGLAAAGVTAGRTAPHSGRFHGSLAGMGIALVVVVVARLGGSPAPTGQVLWLSLLAMAIGGSGGWYGARRKPDAANH